MIENCNDWPITRSELMGRYKLSRKGRTLGIAAFLLMSIANVGLFMIAVATAQPVGGNSQVFIILMYILAIPWVITGIGFALWRRAQSRWETLAPKIWDADGCICPWCHEDVSSKACEAHGVDSSHRDLLIAHHASAMLDNSGQALQRLVEAVPKPPRRTRLSTGSFGWLMRQTQTIQNQDTDLAIRIRAIINLSLTWFTFVGFILAIVIFLVPGGMKFILASRLTGWFLLMMPVLFFVFNLMSIGPPKCKACRQQCHNLDQEICSECGADLRKPGAINRKELNPKKAIRFVPILIGLFALPFFMSWIVAVLPTPARNAIWGTIGAPIGHFLNLDVATMTAPRAEEEADLTLHLARPNGPGIKHNFDSDFIAKALDLALIPESYREDAARTTVSGSIRLEGTSEDQQIVLIPRIDSSLLGNKGPRLAFGGISIDGGPWSPGASWTLVHEDLDEWWRENASSRNPRPESQLTFRVPVDLQPRLHEIRARCWIVIDGYDWNRLDLTFDADGNPEFPAKAKVYDLAITTTLEAG